MGGQVFLVFRHSPVNKHRVQLQRAQRSFKKRELGIKEQEKGILVHLPVRGGPSPLRQERGKGVWGGGVGEVIASET